MASRKKKKLRYSESLRGELDVATMSIQQLYTHSLNMDDAPDALKMSAKLIDIMEPWTDTVDIATLTECAALAWNSCVDDADGDSGIVGADGRSKTLDDYLDHSRLIERLQVRKRKLYPDEDRSILRVFITEGEGGDPKIVVASGVQAEKVKSAIEKLKALVEALKDAEDDENEEDACE